jgi:hypothetical protein
VALLLLWVTFEPVLPRWIRALGQAPIKLPEAVAEDLPSPIYRKILVPLDHTGRDRDAIAHAAAIAKQHHAKLYLLHVEEGVTSHGVRPAVFHRRGGSRRPIPCIGSFANWRISRSRSKWWSGTPAFRRRRSCAMPRSCNRIWW